MLKKSLLCLAGLLLALNVAILPVAVDAAVCLDKWGCMCGNECHRDANGNCVCTGSCAPGEYCELEAQ